MNHTYDKDRFQLTRTENIALAKMMWDANVFCGMKMENRNITFSETKAILSGINVASAKIDDVYAVCRYRDAWRFMMDTLDEPLTLEYMIHLNEIIARGEALEVGKLRTGSVTIADTAPAVPTAQDVSSALDMLQRDAVSDTHRALHTFSLFVRMQPFWDGNKRTAMLMANKDLIAHGRGLLLVTDQNGLAFQEALYQYLQSADAEPFHKCLFEQCLAGLNKQQKKASAAERLAVDTYAQQRDMDEPEL